MAYSDNMLSSIKSIASQAWGSGTFEGKKGGEGYMGALVDSTTGNVRVVKMLTHRKEYGAVKSQGGEAAFASAHADLAESTRQLKETLMTLARASGSDDVFAKVSNLVEGKPLLSRKIVAKVVDALTEGLDRDDFSWEAAKRDAQTYADTTLATVSAENAALDDGTSVTNARFAKMGHDLNVEIADTVATSVADSAAKIRAGRFDQGWRNAFATVVTTMGDRLNGLVRGSVGELSFAGIEVNAKDNMMLGEDQRLFHRIFREEVAKAVEKLDAFPLNETQKLRIMAKAFKKAFVLAQVARAAQRMIDEIARRFPSTELHPNRAAAYENARARINDLKALSQGFETHFGFNQLKNDVQLNGQYGADMVTLVRQVFSCDTITIGDLADAEDVDCPADLSSKEPKVNDGGSVGEGVADLFECFHDGQRTDAARAFAHQMNQFVTWFMPTTTYAGLDISGESAKGDLTVIQGDVKFEIS